jgi:hypothetical protein
MVAEVMYAVLMDVNEFREDHYGFPRVQPSDQDLRKLILHGASDFVKPFIFALNGLQTVEYSLKDVLQWL